MKKLFRLQLLAATLASIVATPAAPLRAESFCAVFFDLGNTLINQSGPSPWPLFGDAQATIDELQARGVRLGVITNTPAGWHRPDLEAILQQPAVLDEFDVLTLSSEAGVAKPAPAIYTMAFAALPLPGLGIGRTAFVGESIAEIADAASNPTLGARAAGMVGIHLSSAAPDPRADHTIANLTALLAIATESCYVFLDDFEDGSTTAWSACTGCG